jgi:hypothetical protein
MAPEELSALADKIVSVGQHGHSRVYFLVPKRQQLPPVSEERAARQRAARQRAARQRALPRRPAFGRWAAGGRVELRLRGRWSTRSS